MRHWSASYLKIIRLLLFFILSIQLFVCYRSLCYDYFLQKIQKLLLFQMVSHTYRKIKYFYPPYSKLKFLLDASITNVSCSLLFKMLWEKAMTWHYTRLFCLKHFSVLNSTKVIESLGFSPWHTHFNSEANASIWIAHLGNFI